MFEWQAYFIYRWLHEIFSDWKRLWTEEMWEVLFLVLFISYFSHSDI